jgi:hypothetical protein
MKVCSVLDCNGRAIARGYCSRHYSRWQKHGDPLAGRTTEGAVPKWLYDNAMHAGDDCLIFPFARNNHGYGALKFEGRIMAASRAMCIIAHGHPPDPSLVAAHSCGKGHTGCVNPKHLRWATYAENALDLAEHREAGIAPPHPSRLNSADCRDIIASKGREFMWQTAKRYGISESMVCRIQKGNRRANVLKGVA